MSIRPAFRYLFQFDGTHNDRCVNSGNHDREDEALELRIPKQVDGADSSSKMKTSFLDDVTSCGGGGDGKLEPVARNEAVLVLYRRT